MLRVLRFAIRRRTGGRGDLRRGDHSGNQGRSDIRGYVKYGVNAVWEEGERVLRVEEPNQGQHYERGRWLVSKIPYLGCRGWAVSTNQDTERSRRRDSLEHFQAA